MAGMDMHIRENRSQMDRAGSVKDLAGELLALKKASGSSFVQLSEKTHYAKSSWERWVNGKQFPPRDAVERLARLCETDPAPLLALWDEEDARRSAPESEAGEEPEGREESGAGAGAGDGAADGAATSRRRRVLWASVVLAVLLVAGSLLYAAFSDSGEPKDAPRPKPVVTVAGPATGCTLTGCEGRDPKKMNCGADAVTVRTGSIPKDLVIELR